MLLRGFDETSVGVSIADYEFEETDGLDVDRANWLKVRLDISSATGHGWCKTPCLTTSEVKALITWLRVLADLEIPNADVKKYMLFREPNIQFELESRSKEIVSLLVVFNLEQPGEWTRSDQSNSHRTWSGKLQLTVLREQVVRAADDLEQQSLNYPPRNLA